MAKVLFVHTSKQREPKLKLIPVGTFALADLISRNSHKVEIINNFVEKQLDKDFNLVDEIKKYNPDFLCIAIHWHFQSAEVIDQLKQIKAILPKTKIIIGGFTASSFPEELIKKFLFIDYIIKGDAEEPLLELVKGYKESSIANLVYRNDENKPVINEKKFIADEKYINKLNFTNLNLLRHKEEYLKIISNNEGWFFVYNAGRGCPVNCSFCSGSCESQKIINGREKPVFIDQEKAIEELKNLAKNGEGTWYTCYDPYPEGDYYQELFKKIKQNNIKIRCKFESWGLPSKDFIDSFKEAFLDGSEIVLSPETGDEEVRKKNKGYYYKNQLLLECIDYLEQNNIRTIVYFTAGLPFEKDKSIVETLKLINIIRTNFPKAKMLALPIELEPKAPWFENPEKFNISKKRNTFKDFYNAHKEKPSLGYSTEFFSEEEILELVNLLNSEVNCKKSHALFLKIIASIDFNERTFDPKEVWKLCSPCEHFKECFGQ